MRQVMIVKQKKNVFATNDYVMYYRAHLNKEG